MDDTKKTGPRVWAIIVGLGVIVALVVEVFDLVERVFPKGPRIIATAEVIDFAYPPQDSPPTPTYTGLWIIKVRNSGNRQASDLVADLPMEVVSLVRYPDGRAQTNAPTKTIKLGSLRSNKEIEVLAWCWYLPHALSERTGAQITHKEGVAPIDIGRTVYGFDKALVERLTRLRYGLPFALPLILLMLWIVIMIHWSPWKTAPPDSTAGGDRSDGPTTARSANAAGQSDQQLTTQLQDSKWRFPDGKVLTLGANGTVQKSWGRMTPPWAIKDGELHYEGNVFGISSIGTRITPIGRTEFTGDGVRQ